MIPGFEQAFAGFAGNFGAGIGEAIGGGAGPFMGGSSQAAAYGTTLDGANWSVNVGGTQTATPTATRTTTNSAPGQAEAAGFFTPTQQAGGSAVAMLLLASVALGLLLKRKQ